MVYALSDIHGDYEQAVKLLSREGVVDGDGNWTAGTSTLINTGDSVDRGRWGWKVLRWFQTLERQAQEAGGKAIHLLGNHDVWLLAYTRQVKAFYTSQKVTGIRHMGETRMSDVEFLLGNPDLFEWLSTRPLMCRVDNILYQHVDDMYVYLLLDETRTLVGDELIAKINAEGRNRISTMAGAFKYGDDLTFARHWNNEPLKVRHYLTLMGVEQVVHGHSPVGRRRKPYVYLQGRVVNIDGMMSRGYAFDKDDAYDDEDNGIVFVAEPVDMDIAV